MKPQPPTEELVALTRSLRTACTDRATWDEEVPYTVTVRTLRPGEKGPAARAEVKGAFNTWSAPDPEHVQQLVRRHLRLVRANVIEVVPGKVWGALAEEDRAAIEAAVTEAARTACERGCEHRGRMKVIGTALDRAADYLRGDRVDDAFDAVATAANVAGHGRGVPQALQELERHVRARLNRERGTEPE